MPRPPVRIDLLRTFRVSVAGEPVPEPAWRGRRPRQLVQMLALSAGRRLTRDEVIDALWPELDFDAAGANLRKVAHYVRRATGRSDAIVLQGGIVALFPESPVEVDLDGLETAAQSVEGDEAAQLADRYHGELLPDARYDEWTQVPRRRAHELVVNLWRRSGRWDRLVEVEPTDEAAYAELMRDALGRGQPHEAIAWYGRLRSALSDELGLTPGPEVQGLYDECVTMLSPGPAEVIGRQAELAETTAVLRSESPDARCILITGDAGIGKTTLAREMATTGRAEGWSVSEVSVTEAAGPYVALGHAVEGLIRSGRAVLDRITPAAARVLRELSPSTAGGGAEILTRHRVIGAVQQVCDEVAGRGAMIVLDDADLADDATRDGLVRLTMTGRRVLVVLVARTTSADRLRQQIAVLRRANRLSEIDLRPLPDTDAAAIARRSAPPSATDGDIRRMVTLAEGNPFLIGELSRSLTASVAAIPASALEAVRARLVDVDDVAAARLERLAVAGDRFDVTSITALVGVDEAEAFRLLDVALSAGVLVVAENRYRFRHGLVREAFLEHVPPHKRIAVHRDAARRLTEQGASAALIAHHWLAGDRPGEAQPWLLTAAEEAMRLGAFRDALQRLDELLAADADHPAAACLRAQALDAVGDPEAAPAFARAIELSDAETAAELVPQYALALLKAGDPFRATGVLEGAEPSSVEGQIRRAITLSGAAAIDAGDPDLAARLAEDARRLAIDSSAIGGLTDAVWAQSLAAHSRGELTERLAADLLETATLEEVSIRVFDGHLCATERLLYGALPYDQVRSFATSLAEQAQRLGAVRGEAFARTLRGEANLLSGRLEQARADLDVGIQLHRSIRAAAGESLATQRLAETALLQDGPADAHRLLTASLDAARDSSLGHHLLDRIYGTRIALADDPAQIETALDEAEVAVQGPFETCPACRITLTHPAAIGATIIGDLERAERYAAVTEQLATVMLHLPAWHAAVDELHGRIAATRGDKTTAQHHLLAAADAFAAAGHVPDENRCRSVIK